MPTSFTIACRIGLAAIAALAPIRAVAQGRPTSVAATRAASGELRAVDELVDQMIRSRALVLTEIQRDPLMPDRQHERLEQFLRGVRVIGGDLTRQIASDGTVSVFGMLHGGVDLDLTPALSAERARAAIARAVSGDAFGADPELVVLPMSDGYHLAYFGQATAGVEILNVFVDATSGALLR